MSSTTRDEMDGVSRGLMMRVAVCGWGAGRGEVHENAGRRIESAEGARRAERSRGRPGAGGAGACMRVQGGRDEREPERVDGGPHVF